MITSKGLVNVDKTLKAESRKENKMHLHLTRYITSIPQKAVLSSGQGVNLHRLTLSANQAQELEKLTNDKTIILREVKIMTEKIMNYAHDIRQHAALIGIDVEELVRQTAQYYNISEEETDFYAVCEYIAANSEYNKYF